MKKYHLNKKEILYWASKARRYLNLPKIKINIVKILYTEIEEGGVSFSPELKCINLIQPVKDLIVERISGDFAGIGYSKEWLIFSIFHEMAHYFQWYYHSKWVGLFYNSEKYYNFNGKHCDKKLEKNADKITIILFNKLYKNKK
jgi:hypothetical protein